MITVKNLTKKFGTTKAVNGISFAIDKGEVVGLLGPNGAGKTTTMRMITGFLATDRGIIDIDGHSIEDDPIVVQKKIGYLPENNPLYKSMQVGEFLNLAADLHQIPDGEKDNARDFVVRAVGIADVYHKPIGELSKGYKQRVGIAAALIHRPEIIILDEPTEGLDPNQRTEIRQLIRDLSKNHTIIMSTHVMQEASAVCDRLLIIADGKVIADGTPQKLAQTSQDKSLISCVIEGRSVVEGLKGITHVQKVRTLSHKGEKYTLEIAVDADHDIEPQIAEKVWEYRWIVWRLERQENDLEDIFQTLTKKHMKE